MKLFAKTLLFTTLLTIWSAPISPLFAASAPQLALAEPAVIHETLDIGVSQSTDDAEERLSDGLMYLTSNDLELINDIGDRGEQVVGIRFQGVTIPSGASITEAHLVFNAQDADDEATTLIIAGEDIGNAQTFTETTAQLSSRPKTQATVEWPAVEPWIVVNELHNSPNIAPIVQEIIERSDWTSGNSMAFIITGSGQRTATSFDNEPASAPRLVITYAAADDRPRNIIVMIGDGMGFQHVKAASLYRTGAEDKLSFQDAPYQAEMTTSSANRLVTDSAASGTAMATGRKVNNRVISVALPGDGSDLESSLEYFADRCKSTGLVVNGYVDEATPAVFGAHEASRQSHLPILNDYFTGSRPTVLFGDYAGGYTDTVISNAGYTVVDSRAAMQAIDPLQVERVFGTFLGTAPLYAYDYSIGRHDIYATQPHLAEMTASALEILDKDPDGFFMMIEGSRIDHVATLDDPDRLARTVYETLEFADAVQVVLDWIANRTDTLVIVTADHETGGLWVLRSNGVGNFPTVHWEVEDHTAVNVPVYAWGPNAEMVEGKIDNTDIYRISTANSVAEGQICLDQLDQRQFMPLINAD